MQSLDILIETCEWFGKNFAWNLNALPEDKLDWKPAPTAKSAFEVTLHTANVLSQVQRSFAGQDAEEPLFSLPTTREQAQDMIIAAANEYADFLRGLDGDLSGDIELPSGNLPRLRYIAMPVQDLVHHHGQVAYIQTLLGDTSDHFFEFESGD